MGGHGGLNILPQKRWNVYNFDNREKVKKDEEAAAKEEQIKREQSRKRDTEFRIQKLKLAKGLQPDPSPQTTADSVSVTTTNSINNHVNLFEGIKVFPYLSENKDDNGGFKRKKLKKEEEVKVVVSAEDEKYRLGYGIAGKGVKAPWYVSRPVKEGDGEIGGSSSLCVKKEEKKKSGKKTLEKLREERLKREKREKERELALLREKNKRKR